MPRCVSLALIALALGLGFSSGLAQEFRTTLSGQVQDSQGGAVPKASIVARNVGTGAQFTTTSGDTGQFALPFLPPGSYTVAVEAPGFKRYTRDDVAISTNQRISIDIELEVGAVSESVTVTGAAPLLATGTASIGQGISASLAQDLPMSGRTPLVLARLAFGVVDLSNPGWARPFDSSNIAGSSMGGGRGSTNALLMDGAPVMGGGRQAAYSPPLESVEEVRVEVFQSDAAYGDTSSGTINVVTKSGTNQLHGTAEAYNQASKLSATPFFYNRSGQKNPVTRYNQWSTTAGGPVVIPKLFSGLNKAFWYFAYEGIKDMRPTATITTTTVPTPAMRTGDFSSLLAVGSAYQIYDPLSAVAEGSRRRRQPLAGNMIPQNRINPIAAKYLGFYPLPNQPGRADGQNNYLASPRNTNDYYNFLGRADFNLSSQHKLSWSGRSSYRMEHHNQLFFENEATGHHRERENWGSIIDDVYGFSATTWLNTRVSWNRFIDADTPFTAGYDVTSLGFPRMMAVASARPELPWIVFGDPTLQLGGTLTGDSAGFRTVFDAVQVFSALNKVAGHHSFKLGTEIRRLRESSINYGSASGQFIFGTAWVNGPLDNSPGAPLGQGLASLALGLPTGGGFDVNAFRTNQSWYPAFFLQDDWRPTANLTLNLGLRYEKETPTTERYDRTLIGFDLSSPNGVTAPAKAAYAAAPIPQLPASQFNPVGGPIFATSSRRNVYSTPSNAVSPRIGIAYKPARLGGRTVFRAGLGVFYQPYGTTGVQQPGFSQRTPVVPSQDGYLTTYATLSNPFPLGIQQPVGAAGGLNTDLGKSVVFFNPDLVQPYAARWTFTIQRQLAANLVLEAGYIGSRSLNLTVNQSLNPVPARFLSSSPARDQATINLLTSNVRNPFQDLLPGTGLTGSSTTLEQLLRPYPQYTGDNGLQVRSTNLGFSSYHALDMRIEQRLSHGVQLLASYTFSKNIAAVSFLNPFDTKPERKVASEDRPQRFVVSASYQLPFGKGKAVAPNAGRWLNAIIGGWSVTEILLYQVSGPLGWGNLIYYGGDINFHPSAIDRAFDTSRFNTSSAQQLDRNVRTFPSAFGNLRPNCQKNLDASLRKYIRIREKLSLQYAFDALNATNRVQFEGPNLSATQAGFGTITAQPNRPRAIQMALRLRW